MGKSTVFLSGVFGLRFTISAFNNYGFVKSFLGRAETVHPEINCFVWVVADNRHVWAHDADKSLPAKILDDMPKRWHSVLAEELQPYMNFSFMELAFRYDLQCFNTAIKPAAFKFIFDRFRASKVLYFDNDASLCLRFSFGSLYILEISA